MLFDRPDKAMMPIRSSFKGYLNLRIEQGLVRIRRTLKEIWSSDLSQNSMRRTQYYLRIPLVCDVS